MGSVRTFEVRVGDVTVGRMDVSKYGQTDFRIVESYKSMYPRPVLGQVFLDDLSATHRSRSRLPPWFSNLLPEGALRDLIAKSAGIDRNQEVVLLGLLGEDLPGNVRISPVDMGGQDEEDDVDGHHPVLSPQAEDAAGWHFSLAGVQLKFSGIRHGKGLTIPASGRGGDWIVKLPDRRYEGVPGNEYATMRWAELSGIDIPDIELIELSKIEGLSEGLIERNEPYAYVIRRFDRLPQARVHMEDFAQLLNVYPEAKYDATNYETVAKVVYALTGLEGLNQFLLRLVFILASGNGDAHLKNWSVYYPDGVRPVLSPAYDLVSTIQYFNADRLAMNLGGGKDWGRIGEEVFARLARKVGVKESWVLEGIELHVSKILDAWSSHGASLGYSQQQHDLLDEHIRKIPLLRL